MDRFKALFGMKADAVRRVCILMPFIGKGALDRFGIKKLARGRLYGIGNGDICTVVHTRMGAAFTGDAVLYLSSTPCREIILFGTCGLFRKAPGLGIGTLVSPSRCHARESFTELLTGIGDTGSVFFPDSCLQRELLAVGVEGEIREVTALSVGSLKLTEERRDHCLDRGIQAVEMECAACYAAARRIKRRAAALLVVSDIVGERPFYRKLDPVENDRLLSSFSRAAWIICKCITENLND